MKKPRANVGEDVAVLRRLGALERLVRTPTRLMFAKNSRMSAKTSMPRISVATPMLLRIDSSRTPKR